MADTKISALTAATTPLAGTEVLPIVQSGVTKKVSIANLTAGRQVDTSFLNISSTSNQIGNVNTTLVDGAYLKWQTNGTSIADIGTVKQVFGVGSGTDFAIATRSGKYLGLGANGAESLRLTTTGDASVLTGNLVIGTSGKGIDFSATPGTGTSELLNDYEEGTWTPTQGAGLTVVGAFSSSGTYTKVGRQVTVRGLLNGSTTVAAVSGTVMCGGMPFSASGSGLGTAADNNAAVGSVLYISATNLLSVSNIGASPAIHFGATYFV